MKKILIIGGGLGGLVTSIRLQRAGIPCLVVEKKRYPFHRVCGEYISNECLAFLKSEDLYPAEFSPPAINQFRLSATSGKSTSLRLDLGGFGISRYAFDNYLYEKATQTGVEFLLNTEVLTVSKNGNGFKVETTGPELHADIVVGSFGKRSRIDITSGRSFTRKRSPYVGVKYHAKTAHPDKEIALHNFEGGYCGMSNVENGVTNICYLVHRDVLKKHKNIPDMEAAVLCKNPLLKGVFERADFLFEHPETINEISFETKEPVWNDMLLIGDAAGMIAPLCGNGMAMAIHSAKLLSDLLLEKGADTSFKLDEIQHLYAKTWRYHFSDRLRFGRFVQHYLFGTKWSSQLAVSLALHSSLITNSIVKNTHGRPF